MKILVGILAFAAYQALADTASVTFSSLQLVQNSESAEAPRKPNLLIRGSVHEGTIEKRFKKDRIEVRNKCRSPFATQLIRQAC